MYKDVILAIDLGEEHSWEKALPKAIEMCRDGGNLHVLTVLPEFGMSVISQYFPEHFEEDTLEAAKKALRAFIDKNVPNDVPNQAIVAQGRAYEQILRIADEIGADLIVMAAGNPSLARYLLGPNAARVVRHATCSVLVVR
ncbi:MAG: universal stress protein [Gammaproteobacteria bacterium]|nr:universal stress protein [Gammaproteobacteria bacterium]NIM71886.1 universal stress protein [Gammaproteobacteria bacterium]NIN38008.1 universal stress protein [Gammaproteobacteria bacterium]NIO23642.1 universal stress protein [Gammaproteobacteria bacterium]NIO64258.1 universal stress protein [Gammaproteobacteria bacterium]